MGNAAARAIQGGGVGSDVVVFTGGQPLDPGLTAALRTVTPHGRVIGVDSLSEAVRMIAAGAARRSGAETGLVLVDGAVRLDAPALLDLLDRYDPPTSALVLDPNNPEAPRQSWAGVDSATPLRVGPDGALIESAGSSVNEVGEPNRLSAGVLRLAGADRAAAVRAWTDAARANTDAADPFDLALVALVRSGLPVAARPLGCYRWSRGSSAQSGSPAGASGWRQRLRNASRGGDGLYSFAVVRRISRRGTALGLRFGWSPNGVTAVSLIVGLLAAALVVTGATWGWVLAAVLLQLALVIDCMDGEIARFSRRFSAFGGWLDGVGDRVKEYAVFAAAAAVAVRQGETSGWLLALIAMALVTGRHLEDYTYTDKLAPSRQSRPERLDAGPGPDARAAAGARTTLRPRPGLRARAVFWAKKVVHLPIAERYLLLSVLLLIGRPGWLLVVTIVANALALVWALGGRVARELRGRRPARDPKEAGGGFDAATALDVQLDLGPLARLFGRLPRHGLLTGPYLPGLAGLVLVWLGVIAALCAGLGPVALVGAVLAALITGVTLRAPVRHRFGWLAPPLLWAGEAAVAGALLAQGPVGGAVFGFLAVCAYRRYDLIYSVRLNGLPSGDAARPGWTSGLGVEGRIIGVAVLLTVVRAVTNPAGTNPAGTNSAGTGAGLRVGLLIGVVLVLVPALAATVRSWRPRPVRSPPLDTQPAEPQQGVR